MIAVAAPAAIVAALFALLFVLAWRQWGQAVTNTLNVNLPIIGHALGGLISGALNLAYEIVVAEFDALLYPLAEFIVRPIAAIENGIAAAINAASWTYDAVWSIVWVRIPAAVTQAEGYALGVGNNVLAQADVWVGQAKAYAQSLATNVLAQADVWVVGAETYARSLATNVLTQADVWVNTLRSDVSAAVGAEHAFALDVYQTATAYTVQAFGVAQAELAALGAGLENDIAHAVTAAEAYANTTATTIVGAAVTDIDNAITGALSGIYTDVDAAVDGAIGAITTGDADILAALKAWPASVPLDIAGVAALAGVTSLTLARYLRDCGIPNCQNLSQLGRDISALTSLVGDASFLTLLVELVEHPGNAAGVVESTFGGGINDTISLFKTLVSI